MSIDANTGVFCWTPTEGQGGLTPSVTVTVTDNGTGELTDSETFTITVGDTNLAPVLAAIGNQSVNEGATLSLRQRHRRRFALAEPDLLAGCGLDRAGDDDRQLRARSAGRRPSRKVA